MNGIRPENQESEFRPIRKNIPKGNSNNLATAEIQKATLMGSAEIAVVVTPAQRSHLEELRAERRKKMMENFRKTR